jgi:hypothetical protein
MLANDFVFGFSSTSCFDFCVVGFFSCGIVFCVFV